MMPTGVAELIPLGPKKNEPNRRTRLRTDTAPQLRGWLHRCARMHAVLAATVRLYGRPDRAGGQSKEGDTYAARVARGDVTILHDTLSNVLDEATAIRNEVESVINDVEPTPHPPGSREKVAVLRDRMSAGVSLFVPADARVDLE
jgi:hypothetical protein